MSGSPGEPEGFTAEAAWFPVLRVVEAGELNRWYILDSEGSSGRVSGLC